MMSVTVSSAEQRLERAEADHVVDEQPHDRAQLGGVQLDLQVDDDLLDDLGDLVAQLLRPERRGDRDVDALHQERHHLLLDLLLALAACRPASPPRAAGLGQRVLAADRRPRRRRRRRRGRWRARRSARRRCRAGAGAARAGSAWPSLAATSTVERLVGHLGELDRRRPARPSPSVWRDPLGRGRAQRRQARPGRWRARPASKPSSMARYFLLKARLKKPPAGLASSGHAGELDAELVQVGDHLVLGIGGRERLALEARLGHRLGVVREDAASASPPCRPRTP